MAAKIFADHKLLEAINAVIHPAVKAYILQEIEAEREAGKIDAFFVEAALLIEEGYGELLDELWYIFAQKEVRRKRLMQDRGYSEEKVEQIFASQLSEEEFRCHCKVVIDDGADLGDTYRTDRRKIKGSRAEQMRLCSIASGSSGNCIYAGTDTTHVLVDAGISGKRVENGLNDIGLTGRDIDAILITHERMISPDLVF